MSKKRYVVDLTAEERAHLKTLIRKGKAAALRRKRREIHPVKPVVDGEKQAKLTALACSKPPKGRCKWTLRLLAETRVPLPMGPGLAACQGHRSPKAVDSKNIAKPHHAHIL